MTISRKPTDLEFMQANALLDAPHLKLSGFEKLACNRICDLRAYPYQAKPVTQEQWDAFDILKETGVAKACI